ncbi:MAG: acyl--CoA ligase, partial [Planctomycetota bacterium]|nr:acyl--CoA ligase [Planctomycetota bacterium]
MGRRTIFTAGDLLLQHAGTGNDRIALIAGDEQISYDELISRATRIAAWLAADGVQPRDRVAIMLRKTPRLVSVLLGVYLSGAAAVLVHEKHKAKQIDHVLEHSGAVRLLSEHRLLRGARGTRFDADRIRDLGAIELPQRRLDVSRAVGEDLAQIIYTSGSTG